MSENNPRDLSIIVREGNRIQEDNKQVIWYSAEMSEKSIADIIQKQFNVFLLREKIQLGDFRVTFY